MKLNKFKQIIREEIFNEIRVERGMMLTPKGEELAQDWKTFSDLSTNFIYDWDGFNDSVNEQYNFGMWCYECINNRLLGDKKIMSMANYEYYLENPAYSFLELAEIDDLKANGLLAVV